MLQVLLVFYLPFFVLAQWGNDYYNDDYCTTPDNQIGSCTQIHGCKPILDFLDEVAVPIPQEVQNFLKSYQCGVDRQRPKVCCPNSPIVFNKDAEFPDVSKHRNFRLLPQDCGYLDTDNKITHGQKTGIYEFPWMTLLSFNSRNGPQFKCGGTIINERYILTAAHCLSNQPLIGVRIGEHNIRTERDCESTRWGETCAPPYQDLRVEDVIIHPNFNARELTNDIGLIRVPRINLSLENSRPVCLPLAESRNYNFTARSLIVTGWGVTERGFPSPELLKVSLSVTSLQDCGDLYKKIAKIDSRQLCAGGKNKKDSCAGDSGGPLHVLGRINGELKMIQQGIVSFGPKICGETPVPGVYTRVSAFMDWILDNIRP